MIANLEESPNGCQDDAIINILNTGEVDVRGKSIENLEATIVCGNRTMRLERSLSSDAIYDEDKALKEIA